MKFANNNEILEANGKYLMNTYGRLPIAFVDGHESTLVSKDGKEYLDFVSGIAVNSLGYSNKRVQEALKEQVDKIIHTSNLFLIENQAMLGKMLCENSFADKVFFANSGAEANEGAIKIARRRATTKYGENKNEVISMTSSFHGRTLMTLSMTDSKKYREGYGPHPEGFKFAEYNNIESLKALVNENTAAVILETIQGEGGVYEASAEFLEFAREITKKYDAALIFDEVQCGMGRTGKLFAYEHYGVTPDIMTLAKALGNGVPIGAILAKGDFAETFTPGSHGTTFGGNLLSTAAGIAVLSEMLEKNIPSVAEETGNYFRKKLLELKEEFGVVVDVRGKGLLLGIELSKKGNDIVPKMLEKGFIINCTHDYVLRFIPPLIIKKEEIDTMIYALKECLKEL